MKNIFFLYLFCYCFFAHSQTTGEYIDKGVVKYESGDYSGAIQEYSKAIAVNSNSLTSYFNRGLAKMQLNDYPGAIVDFTSYLELNSTKEEVYSLRGKCKMELEDFAGAMRDYNMAIKINQTAEHYINRGHLKYRMKDFKGSISDCSAALKLEPDNSRGYLIRGVSKLALEDAGGCLDLSRAGELGDENAYRVIKDLCNGGVTNSDETLAQSLVDHLNKFLESTNKNNVRNFARLENNSINIYFESYMDIRPSDNKDLTNVFREIVEGAAEDIILKTINRGIPTKKDRELFYTAGIARINFIFLSSYADQTESRVERYVFPKELAALNVPSLNNELLSIMKGG